MAGLPLMPSEKSCSREQLFLYSENPALAAK